MLRKLLLLIAGLCIGLGAAKAARADMLVAGDKANLWIVRVNPHGEFTVLHRTHDAAPDTIYTAFKAKGDPVAVAAYDDQLYCVYSDRSVQALTFAPTQDYLPELRPQQLPPLPNDGRVIDMVAGRGGPFVLMRRPESAATQKPRVELLPEHADGASTAVNPPTNDQPPEPAPATDDDAASHESPTPPSPLVLYQLRMSRWQMIDLPPHFSPDHLMQMVMIDPKHDRIALLSETQPPSGLVTDTWNSQTWRRDQYVLKLSPQARGVGLQGDLAVVAPLAGADSRQLNLFYMRQGSATPLNAIGPIIPGVSWWATTYNDKLTVVFNDPQGKLQWAQQSLAPNAPRTASLHPLRETEPTNPTGPLMTLFISALMLGMLILFATARQDPGAHVPHLPPDMGPAGFARIVAAMIDLAPAIALAALFMHLNDPNELFAQWPGEAAQTQAATMLAIAVAIFIVHTTVGELLFAASLGKALTGLRVVNLTGGPPHIWQVFARGLCKGLELLAPPLLAFALLTMHHQRLGDRVAGTVVVRRYREPA